MSYVVRKTASLEVLLDYVDRVTAGLSALPVLAPLLPPWEALRAELRVARDERDDDRLGLTRARARARVLDAEWDEAVAILSAEALLAAGRDSGRAPYSTLFGTVSAAEAADLGAHKAKAFGELLLEKARLLHEAQPALEAPAEAFRRAQEALVEATSRRDDAEVQAAVHDVARRQLLARVERQIALTEVSVLTALPGRRDLVRAVLATDSRRRRRPSPPAEAADVASGNDG